MTPDKLKALREAEKALVDMRKAFGDPLTRRALGGHNDAQMAAMMRAREALSLISQSGKEEEGGLQTIPGPQCADPQTVQPTRSVSGARETE